MTEPVGKKHDIKNELETAVRASILSRYSVLILQFCSVAILARIFTPEMLGIMAVGQVFILFFQTLASSGIAPAIVYLDKLGWRERDGIFTVSALGGIGLCLAYVVLSPFLATLIDSQYGQTITLILATNIIFVAMALVPTASLQKDKKFAAIGQTDALAELSSLFVCLIFYYFGFGLYALFIKLATVPVFRFVLCYLFSKQTSIGQPRFGGDLRAVRRIYSFSAYQIVFNILNFFSRNMDTILVSYYFGPYTLGLYDQVYRVMRYPLQLFTFALTPALHPVLTRHKEYPELVLDSYLTVAFRLSVLGAAVGTAMYWVSKDLLLILLGPQWLEAAPILRIFAVSIALQMVLSSTGGVFQSFGASRHMMYCGLFSACVNLFAMAIGIYMGDIYHLSLLLILAFAINYAQAFFTLNTVIPDILKKPKFWIATAFVALPYINLFFRGDPQYTPASTSWAFFWCGVSAFGGIIAAGVVLALLDGAAAKLLHKRIFRGRRAR